MRSFVCCLLAAASLSIVLSGCAPAPSTAVPTAIPTPAPTTTSTAAVTTAPATSTPSPSARPSASATPPPAPTIARASTPVAIPAVQPPGARTGLSEVDAIIQAYLGRDVSARRSLVRFLTAPCTTAQGMGGPPKCATGEAEGTKVTVFPFLGSEGEYVRQDGIDRVIQFEVEGLWAVYRPFPSSYADPYWPSGVYVLVFVCKEDLPVARGSRQQAEVYVEGGAVVRIARSPLRAAWPPDDAAGGTWLLAPVK